MRTILAQLKQYKKDSILTPLFTALEVIMEVMLPFITALIIDEGIQEGNMRKVYTYGGIMIVMAFISLISGAMAGKYAASASSGLACNLRKGIYDKVQDFSFSNIDKFSTAGLVTRMTTDVTNIQNAYQMCIRVAVRALLKNPRILILDDSTSAVDTATDARIREAFAAAIPGITKIIIAQRISSVQHADHILVMEDGRINGYGTHDQLVRSNEIYREIYESQSRGGGDFDQVQAENAGKESVA